MADVVLIDTDILIDAGRDVLEAVQRLKQEESQATLAVSVITQMELLIGCQNKREQQRLERFLARFDVVRLDAAISDKAVDLLRRYRLSHGLLIADALIAATALSLDIPLLTKNQRDYRFIADLRLLPYP